VAKERKMLMAELIRIEDQGG